MPRIPRKFVFDPTEVGVYHCINRCVRRAFLCGTDIVSGKCFDHRKDWIQQRLEFLAGLAYVELNPIRAGIAETPETSRFTSVFERIQALCEANTGPADPATPEVVSPAVAPELAASEAVEPGMPGATETVQPHAEWLSPFELSTATDQPAATCRASNTGCLPMKFSDYLQLLDWTGRQVRADKQGAIPQELAPIFERLQMSSESWLNLVHEFRRKFRRAAGTPASLLKEAQKRGCQKMQGIMHSRAIFEPPPRSTA